MEMGLVVWLKILQDFQDSLQVFWVFRLKILQDPAGFFEKMSYGDGFGVFACKVEDAAGFSGFFGSFFWGFQVEDFSGSCGIFDVMSRWVRDFWLSGWVILQGSAGFFGFIQNFLAIRLKIPQDHAGFMRISFFSKVQYLGSLWIAWDFLSFL